MPQLAVPVAAEAAVATTMTAAEIAAAEAAAAHAAEVAAAQVLAAEQAAAAQALAAEQAAAQAATQASTSGIQTLAQEVATTTPPTGIETLNMGQVPVTGPTPTVNDQLVKIFQDTQLNTPSMTAEQFLNNSVAGPPVSTSSPFNPAQPFANSTYASAPSAPPPVVAPPVVAPPAPPPVDYVFSRPDMGGAGGVQQGFGNTGMQARLTPDQLAGPNQYSITQGLNYQSPLSASVNATPTPEPNFLQSAFKDFKDMPLKDKLLTGLMGSAGYEMLNKPKPEEKKKYKSSFRSDLYTGYKPVQPTPYPYPVGYAVGGIADLGGYSDYARGGRMLKGPGDGMSDDIPATIAGKQPARLANEEFVIPADVVSHLGNGSSEAGAKQLYKMMDRIRKARTGTKKQGKQINPEKYLA